MSWKPFRRQAVRATRSRYQRKLLRDPSRPTRRRPSRSGCRPKVPMPPSAGVAPRPRCPKAWRTYASACPTRRLDRGCPGSLRNPAMQQHATARKCWLNILGFDPLLSIDLRLVVAQFGRNIKQNANGVILSQKPLPQCRRHREHRHYFDSAAVDGECRARSVED